MDGVNQPNMTRMERIVAARYAPLVLTHPLSPLLNGDHQKYMPKYTGEEDTTAEEHLAAFYSYADNQNIEAEDVWMRVFVQSLDREARKWFRGLPAASILDIDALDEAFLKHWGDKKDFLYYVTEFGNLKRKNGESVSDFSKRFNKMYSRIPDEVKPSETLAKITYANAFDGDFRFALRERKSATLASMQDAALEVESNGLARDMLNGTAERKKGKDNHKPSASSSKSKLDDLTKSLESLTSKLEKLEMDSKGSYKGKQENFQKNYNQPYRKFNQPTHILQREKQTDEKALVPIQTNLLIDEEEEELEEENEIHLMENIPSSAHLTQE